jgi:hypothetical protein
MKEDSAKMDNPEREKKLMDVLKSAQVISLTRMFLTKNFAITRSGSAFLVVWIRIRIQVGRSLPQVKKK